MSKKPSFLTKTAIEATNKKQVVFHIKLEDGETTEFILNWTVKHSSFYQNEAKRLGKDSLMRKITDLSKFASKLNEKKSKAEKDTGNDVDNLDAENKFELVADYYDIMENSTLVFYEILNAYGRIEYAGDWTQDDSANLHTMITSSYKTEDLFAETQKLFGLILGNSSGNV
jgi:hypothetical protein